MMRGMSIAGALAVLAGCPSGDPVEPDGRPDGGSGNGGLTVRFVADQPVPGEVDDIRRLTEVKMRGDSVRAIGDAAPGDARTTRNDYELRWHDSDAPEAIYFEVAPVGLYSSVEVRLEGGGENEAFEIEGEALVEAEWHDFEIVGEEPLTIMIATDTELAIGSTATIRVDVDLASIIAGIDFTAYPLNEGRIEVDGDATAIRNAIRAAFTAALDGGGDAGT